MMATLVTATTSGSFTSYANTSTNISVALTDGGFSPVRIVAQLNHPVTIRVSNRGSQVHEFAIPYYYIYGENLKPGQTSTIQFTPNTEGSFDMISDPKGTNQPEFKGTFVVTAAK